MKPSIIPLLACSAMLAMTAPLVGCKAQSAHGVTATVPVVIAPAVAPDVVVAVESQPASGPAVVAPAEAALASVESADGASVAAAAGTTNEVAQAVPPVEIKVSEAIRELARLAEAGLSDEVLLAYIENSAVPFNVTSEEIVYLTDLGISDAVIAALIKHRGSAVAGQKAVASTNEVAVAPTPADPASVPQNPSVTVTATPEFEAGQQPQPAIVQQPAVVYTPVYVPQQYNYFYSSLSPYGTWVEVDNFGLCWRPTVAVVNHGWKPYCDRGRWIYTDCGWYWHSDYSWGWAPFHYGRWHSHPRHGWIWSPDTTWGPAWVTWRYSDDYCGWAPLPPGARYEHGFGLHYRSGRVGISFDFGLSRDCYTFVPSSRFCDRTPWRHAVAAGRVGPIYNRTKVVNNFIQNNTVIVNEGIGRERIAKVTRSEVRKVPVRDLPANDGHSTRPERLLKTGPEMVVYRPQLPTQNPASSRSRLEREPQKGAAPSVKPESTLAETKSPAATAVPIQSRNFPSPSSNPGEHRRIRSESGQIRTSTTVAVPSRVTPSEQPTRSPQASDAPKPGLAVRNAPRAETVPANSKPAVESRGNAAASGPQLVHTPMRPIQRRETPAPVTTSPENTRRTIQSTPVVNGSSPSAVFNRSQTPPQSQGFGESYVKPAEPRTSRSTTYGNVQTRPAPQTTIPSRNYSQPTPDSSSVAAPPSNGARPYNRVPTAEPYRYQPNPRSVPTVNSRQELSKPPPSVYMDKRSFVQQAPPPGSSSPRIQSMPTPSRQTMSAPEPVQSRQVTPSPRSAPSSSEGQSRSSSSGSRRGELLR